jgi:hypothetical protein
MCVRPRDEFTNLNGTPSGNIAYLAFVLPRSTYAAFYQDARVVRVLARTTTQSGPDWTVPRTGAIRHWALVHGTIPYSLWFMVLYHTLSYTLSYTLQYDTLNKQLPRARSIVITLLKLRVHNGGERPNPARACVEPLRERGLPYLGWSGGKELTKARRATHVFDHMDRKHLPQHKCLRPRHVFNQNGRGHLPRHQRRWPRNIQ